jgi:uncharacterized protein (TIGR00730 family)
MATTRICVFCGSSPGADPAYAAAARRFGDAVARRGHELVYGGGSVGLMGTVADAALAAGGKVTGVIPRALQLRELAHPRLTTLVVTGSMHERKAKMAELAHAFVALPGGLGTLEELAEIVTWAQLGIHARPCALLDVKGYWRPLVEFLDHAVAAGFVSPLHRSLLLVEEEPEPLLDRLAAWRPPEIERWLDSRGT